MAKPISLQDMFMLAHDIEAEHKAQQAEVLAACKKAELYFSADYDDDHLALIALREAIAKLEGK